MGKKDQHVVPHNGKWAVKSPGSSTPSSTHKTQSAAISRAKTTAKQNQSELYIHGKNGQIRERNTYGPDPHPPKG